MSSHGPALDRVLDALTAHGDTPRRSGDHWAARCPAHDDRSPSLSIGPAEKFPGAVLKCHTGCHLDDVLAALGLSSSDLFDEARDQRRGSVEVARYAYTTHEGEVLFEKVRRFPKDFRTSPAGVVGRLQSVPLYRLPEVGHAITTGATVYVVEGEKDADRLASLGLTATTNYEGAAKPDQRPKWRPEYADQLAGAHVVIIADDDPPGRAHASFWASQLTARCKSVRVTVPTRGKDVSDHLDAGGTLEELVDLDAAPEPPTEVEEVPEGDPDDPEAAELARVTREAVIRAKATTEARRIIAAEAAGASTLRDELIDGQDLGNLPSPEPIIEGVLPRHAYGILRGRDSTFKTFVALSWALSIATGTRWQGKHVEPMPVLYLAAEGAYGLEARRRAWEEHQGQTVPRGAFTVLPRPVDLFSAVELDPLLDVIDERGIGLVVVDTLRRVSGRADGNGVDMGVVVDNLDRIKRATHHGSVLTLAHTTKEDRDTRGFSGIEDDADVVWATKRDEDEQVIELVNTKMKDGSDGARFTLRPKPVGDSIVLVSAERGTGTSAGGRAEVAVVDALMASDGIADPTGPQLVEAAGVGRTKCYAALRALIDRGVVVKYGDRGAQRYRLTGVEA